jgi:hypothetical protein
MGNSVTPASLGSQFLISGRSVVPPAGLSEESSGSVEDTERRQSLYLSGEQEYSNSPNDESNPAP